MIENPMAQSVLSQLLKTLSEGVLVIDHASRPVYINDLYYQLLGFQKPDIQDNFINKNFIPIKVKRFIEKSKKQPYTQQQTQQVRLQKKDNSASQVTVTVSTLYNQEHHYSGNLIIVKENTSANKGPQLIKQKYEFLTQLLYMEKLAGLGMMVQLLTNDLNHRLHSTKLMLHELFVRIGESPDRIQQSQQLLEMTLQELEQATSIIQSYREISQYKKPACKTEYLLTDIFTKLQAVYQLQKKRDGHFEIILDQSLYDLGFIQTYCDIEQIAFVLIANAYEAAVEGQSNQVKIMCHVKDDELMLTFSDNCAGIKSDDLPHIFDPFYTTKASNQNTGMGLSIVKGLIDLCDGTIQVKSQLGRGTKITVVVPIYQEFLKEQNNDG